MKITKITTFNFGAFSLIFKMGNFIFYSQKNSLVSIVGKIKSVILKISENFTKLILVNFRLQ